MATPAEEMKFNQPSKPPAIDFPQPTLVAWFGKQINVAWGPGLSHTFNGLDDLEEAMSRITALNEIPVELKDKLVGKVRDYLKVSPQIINVPPLQLVS